MKLKNKEKELWTQNIPGRTQIDWDKNDTEFSDKEKIEQLESGGYDMSLFKNKETLADKIKEANVIGEFLFVKHVKEFIERRLERIDLIIKLYPHKSGEELAGQLKEDLMNDAGEGLLK